MIAALICIGISVAFVLFPTFVSRFIEKGIDAIWKEESDTGKAEEMPESFRHPWKQKHNFVKKIDTSKAEDAVFREIE